MLSLEAMGAYENTYLVFVGDYNHPILAYGKFWLSRVYQNQP